MTQALNVVQSFILGLFSLIMAAVAAVQDFLRGLMTQLGIPGNLQKIVLIVVAVLLLVAAVRVFGRVFGVLIAIFLVLFLLQMLVPSLSGSAALHPT